MTLRLKIVLVCAGVTALVVTVMGLAIAFFGHRKGLPLAIRSTLHPPFGDRIHGWVGHGVDVFAEDVIEGIASCGFCAETVHRS